MALNDITVLQEQADGSLKEIVLTPELLGVPSLEYGKVPASQLPSYVDDVIEIDNFEELPITGEQGTIYVALDTNKTYRWSGSTYVEISASPGSTDAVPEGSTNLYHTSARAAAAAPVKSVAGKTGAVSLSPNDIGAGWPLEHHIEILGSLNGPPLTTTISAGRNKYIKYTGPYYTDLTVNLPTTDNQSGDLISIENVIGKLSVVNGGISLITLEGSQAASFIYNIYQSCWDLVPLIDGVRSIGGGGTGASTAAQARANLEITHVAGGGTNAIQPRLSSNLAKGNYCVVAGGRESVAHGDYSVIAGGNSNSTRNTGSVVSGGSGNSASNAHSTVSGGEENATIADYSVVAGGKKNSARGGYSLVGGGQNNMALSNMSGIVGGVNNVAAQKVSRANNILSITNTITVLAATAADFDNTGSNALEIRYFSNQLGWQIAYRTVNSATQIGTNVTLVLTSNVGSNQEPWTDVTVLNTWETDTSAGQVVAGTNNTANGLFDTVGGGIRNSATGSYGVVCGGNDNKAAASQAVVVGGASNSATDPHGVVVGGLGNTAAHKAFVGGGEGNASSGQFAAIGCGRSNVASALHSSVLGGLGNQATGDYSSIIGGARGKTNKFGEVAHASGRFIADGDAQHCMLVARRTTLDATANQPLFLNGSHLLMTIPALTLWSFSIKLAAYSVSDNLGAWWFFRGGIRRNNAGSTVLVGSVTSDSGAETALSSASASVVADDTNDALEVRVTGIAGKTIRWVASIDLAQVSAGAV